MDVFCTVIDIISVCGSIPIEILILWPRTVMVGPRPRAVMVGPRPRAVMVGPRPRSVMVGPRPRAVMVGPRPRAVMVGPRPHAVMVGPRPRVLLTLPLIITKGVILVEEIPLCLKYISKITLNMHSVCTTV